METTIIRQPGTKVNGTLNGTGFWKPVTALAQMAGGLICSVIVISFCTQLVRDSFGDSRREACRKQCRAGRAAAKKRKGRKQTGHRNGAKGKGH